ncbi:MerR family transcriptional regulator [Metabacillus bambusae]|uniref:Chromosome-anchoring protein RacA n=1 Tax=Metabacillus bambusae TaxID=2795218 RepID=A0ABS3N234_9BACI|nr:MerR family transcriptional regulator [Metabacillus bambusae]MBO1511973.1 MerR family transcriptional regulator [Metabacillus bambusae]
MSTAAVAKLLGVSRRTVMRWVNQLNMELDKNELGHYQFTEADIECLKEIQEQTNNQSLPQPTQTNHTTRLGTLKSEASVDTSKVAALNERVDELERKMQSKADDVVSYQLLQHRREMEELINKISSLEKKVEELENSQQKREPIKDNVLVFDQPSAPKKPRRKNLISSIFSF